MSINLLQETRLARATVDEFAEARGPARRRRLAAALATYGSLVNCGAARTPPEKPGSWRSFLDLGGTHVKNPYVPTDESVNLFDSYIEG